MCCILSLDRYKTHCSALYWALNSDAVSLQYFNGKICFPILKIKYNICHFLPCTLASFANFSIQHSAFCAYFLQPSNLSFLLCLPSSFSVLTCCFLYLVHGLSSLPLQQHQQQQQPHLSSHSRREGLAFPSHKPLERTRSEPPPYSHSPQLLLTSHHQMSQQYHKNGLERFKQNSYPTKVSRGRH